MAWLHGSLYPSGGCTTVITVVLLTLVALPTKACMVYLTSGIPNWLSVFSYHEGISPVASTDSAKNPTDTAACSAMPASTSCSSRSSPSCKSTVSPKPSESPHTDPVLGTLKQSWTQLRIQMQSPIPPNPSESPHVDSVLRDPETVLDAAPYTDADVLGLKPRT
eukprot:1190732-Prorocentrum_minimum.AAC.1